MIYLDLFLGFLKVGLFSFGGAYSAIPLVRDVVLSYGWLTEEMVTYIIAVSESTPGPIMVNMATYVGSTQAGILGAALTTTAVALPAFVIILLIMIILKNFLTNKYVKAVLDGLKPCVAGIILAIGVHMILDNCFSLHEGGALAWQPIVLTVVLGGLKYFVAPKMKKKLAPIPMIIIGAVLGVLVYGV